MLGALAEKYTEQKGAKQAGVQRPLFPGRREEDESTEPYGDGVNERGRPRYLGTPWLLVVLILTGIKG